MIDISEEESSIVGTTRKHYYDCPDGDCHDYPCPCTCHRLDRGIKKLDDVISELKLAEMPNDEHIKHIQSAIRLLKGADPLKEKDRLQEDA